MPGTKVDTKVSTQATQTSPLQEFHGGLKEVYDEVPDPAQLKGYLKNKDYAKTTYKKYRKSAYGHKASDKEFDEWYNTLDLTDPQQKEVVKTEEQVTETPDSTQIQADTTEVMSDTTDIEEAPIDTTEQDTSQVNIAETDTTEQFEGVGEDSIEVEPGYAPDTQITASDPVKVKGFNGVEYTTTLGPDTRKLYDENNPPPANPIMPTISGETNISISSSPQVQNQTKGAVPIDPSVKVGKLPGRTEDIMNVLNINAIHDEESVYKGGRRYSLKERLPEQYAKENPSYDFSKTKEENDAAKKQAVYEKAERLHPHNQLLRSIYNGGGTGSNGVYETDESFIIYNNSSLGRTPKMVILKDELGPDLVSQFTITDKPAYLVGGEYAKKFQSDKYNSVYSVLDNPYAKGYDFDLTLMNASDNQIWSTYVDQKYGEIITKMNNKHASDMLKLDKAAKSVKSDLEDTEGGFDPFVSESTGTQFEENVIGDIEMERHQKAVGGPRGTFDDLYGSHNYGAKGKVAFIDNVAKEADMELSLAASFADNLEKNFELGIKTGIYSPNAVSSFRETGIPPLPRGSEGRAVKKDKEGREIPKQLSNQELSQALMSGLRTDAYTVLSPEEQELGSLVHDLNTRMEEAFIATGMPQNIQDKDYIETYKKIKEIDPEWEPNYKPYDKVMKGLVFEAYKNATYEFDKAKEHLYNVGAKHGFKMDKNSDGFLDAMLTKFTSGDVWSRAFYNELDKWDMFLTIPTNLFTLGTQGDKVSADNMMAATAEWVEARQGLANAYNSKRMLAQAMYLNKSANGMEQNAWYTRIGEAFAEGLGRSFANKQDFSADFIETDDDYIRNFKEFSEAYGWFEGIDDNPLYSEEEKIAKKRDVLDEGFWDYVTTGGGGLLGMLPALFLYRKALGNMGTPGAITAGTQSAIPTIRYASIMRAAMLEESIFQLASPDTPVGMGFGFYFGPKFMRQMGMKWRKTKYTTVSQSIIDQTVGVSGGMTLGGELGQNLATVYDALLYDKDYIAELKKTYGDQYDGFTDFAKHKLAELTTNALFGFGTALTGKGMRGQQFENFKDLVSKERREIRRLAYELDAKGFTKDAEFYFNMEQNLDKVYGKEREFGDEGYGDLKDAPDVRLNQKLGAEQLSDAVNKTIDRYDQEGNIIEERLMMETSVDVPLEISTRELQNQRKDINSQIKGLYGEIARIKRGVKGQKGEKQLSKEEGQEAISQKNQEIEQLKGKRKEIDKRIGEEEPVFIDKGKVDLDKLEGLEGRDKDEIIRLDAQIRQLEKNVNSSDQNTIEQINNLDARIQELQYEPTGSKQTVKNRADLITELEGQKKNLEDALAKTGAKEKKDYLDNLKRIKRNLQKRTNELSLEEKRKLKQVDDIDGEGGIEVKIPGKKEKATGIKGFLGKAFGVGKAKTEKVGLKEQILNMSYEGYTAEQIVEYLNKQNVPGLGTKPNKKALVNAVRKNAGVPDSYVAEQAMAELKEVNIKLLLPKTASKKKMLEARREQLQRVLALEMDHVDKWRMVNRSAFGELDTPTKLSVKGRTDAYGRPELGTEYDITGDMAESLKTKFFVNGTPIDRNKLADKISNDTQFREDLLSGKQTMKGTNIDKDPFMQQAFKHIQDHRQPFSFSLLRLSKKTPINTALGSVVYFKSNAKDPDYSKGRLLVTSENELFIREPGGKEVLLGKNINEVGEMNVSDTTHGIEMILADKPTSKKPGVIVSGKEGTLLPDTRYYEVSNDGKTLHITDTKDPKTQEKKVFEIIRVNKNKNGEVASLRVREKDAETGELKGPSRDIRADQATYEYTLFENAKKNLNKKPDRQVITSTTEETEQQRNPRDLQIPGTPVIIKNTDGTQTRGFVSKGVTKNGLIEVEDVATGKTHELPKRALEVDTASEPPSTDTKKTPGEETPPTQEPPASGGPGPQGPGTGGTPGGTPGSTPGATPGGTPGGKGGGGTGGGIEGGTGGGPKEPKIDSRPEATFLQRNNMKDLLDFVEQLNSSDNLWALTEAEIEAYNKLIGETNFDDPSRNKKYNKIDKAKRNDSLIRLLTKHDLGDGTTSFYLKEYVDNKEISPERAAKIIDDILLKNPDLKGQILGDPVLMEFFEQLKNGTYGKEGTNIGGMEQPPGSRPTDSGATGETGYGKRPALQVVSGGNIPKPKTTLGSRWDELLDESQKLGTSLIVDSYDNPNSKGFLLADGTGVGKTRQMLVSAEEIAKKSGKPVLVVVPNKQIIEGSWTHDAEALGIQVQNVNKQQKEGTSPNVYIGTYKSLGEKYGNEVRIKNGGNDLWLIEKVEGEGAAEKIYTIKGTGKNSLQTKKVKADYLEPYYSAVIFDEAHYLKNSESSRAIEGKNVLAEHKVFATATPLDRGTGAAYFISEVTGRPLADVLFDIGYESTPTTSPSGKEYIALQYRQGFGPRQVLEALTNLRDNLISQGMMIRRALPPWGEFKQTEYVLESSKQTEHDVAEEWWDTTIENAPPNKARTLKGRKLQDMSYWTEAQKVDDVMALLKQERGEGKSVIVVAEGVNDGPVQFKSKELTAYKVGDKVLDYSEFEGVQAHLLPANKKRNHFEITEIKEGEEGVEYTLKLIQKGTDQGMWAGIEEGKTITTPAALRGNEWAPIEKRFIGDITDKLSKAGIKYASVFGKADKAAQVQRFQKGEVDVLIMTPGSGGAGINLDDTSPKGTKPRTLVMVTPNFAGDTFDQVLGRVQRKTQTSPANTITMFADVYSDNVRGEILERKIANLKSMQEGREPEFVDIEEGVDQFGKVKIRTERIGGAKPGMNYNPPKSLEEMTTFTPQEGREYIGKKFRLPNGEEITINKIDANGVAHAKEDVFAGMPVETLKQQIAEGIITEVKKARKPGTTGGKKGGKGEGKKGGEPGWVVGPRPEGKPDVEATGPLAGSGLTQSSLGNPLYRLPKEWSEEQSVLDEVVDSRDDLKGHRDEGGKMDKKDHDLLEMYEDLLSNKLLTAEKFDADGWRELIGDMEAVLELKWERDPEPTPEPPKVKEGQYGKLDYKGEGVWTETDFEEVWKGAPESIVKEWEGQGNKTKMAAMHTAIAALIRRKPAEDAKDFKEWETSYNTKIRHYEALKGELEKQIDIEVEKGKDELEKGLDAGVKQKIEELKEINKGFDENIEIYRNHKREMENMDPNNKYQQEQYDNQIKEEQRKKAENEKEIALLEKQLQGKDKAVVDKINETATNLNKSGAIYNKETGKHEIVKDNELVIVDVAKANKLWMEDGDGYFASKGDWNYDTNKYKAKERIAKNIEKGDIVDAPIVDIGDYEYTSISTGSPVTKARMKFTDDKGNSGRQLFAQFRDKGATKIALSMSPESAKKARELGIVVEKDAPVKPPTEKTPPKETGPKFKENDVIAYEQDGNIKTAVVSQVNSEKGGYKVFVSGRGDVIIPFKEALPINKEVDTSKWQEITHKRLINVKKPETFIISPPNKEGKRMWTLKGTKVYLNEKGDYVGQDVTLPKSSDRAAHHNGMWEWKELDEKYFSPVVGERLLGKEFAKKNIAPKGKDFFLPGRSTKIRMADNSEMKEKVQYAIVPLESIEASHKVSKSTEFEYNERYPQKFDMKTINDRDYTSDKLAYQKVVNIANRIDPGSLISNANTPVEGPPVITIDGVVVSGNGRTMALKYAEKHNRPEVDKYIDYLKDQASLYMKGTPEEIDKAFEKYKKEGKIPVLVRLDRGLEGEEYNTSLLKRYNAEVAQAKTELTSMIEMSKIFSDPKNKSSRQTLNSIIGGYEKLSDFYGNRADVNKVVTLLKNAGVVNEMNEGQIFNRKSNELTSTGKSILQAIMMGGILKEGTIEMVNSDASHVKTINNKLATLVPALSANVALTPEYSLKDNLNEGMNILQSYFSDLKDQVETGHLSDKMHQLPFQKWLKQPTLFAEAKDPYAAGIAQLLLSNRKTVKDFLDRYNKSAKLNESGKDLTNPMFKEDQLSKEQIFDRLLKDIDPKALEAKQIANVKMNESKNSTSDNAKRKKLGQQEKDESPDRVISGYETPAEGENRNDYYTESDLDSSKKLYEISESTLQDLGFKKGKEVRVGFMRWISRGKALGWFIPGTGEIRINNMNDLSVFAHELGHKLEKETFDLTGKLNVLKDPIVKAFEKNDQAALEQFRIDHGNEAVDGILQRKKMADEIIALAKESGHLDKGYKKAEYVEEALAEYIRMYVWGETKGEIKSDGSQDILIPNVRARAPEFTKYFEGLMESSKRFRTVINNLKSDVDTWKKLPLAVRSAQKIRSRYPMGDEKVPITQRAKNYVYNKWENMKLDPKGNLIYNWIDDLYYWRKLSQQVRKINPQLSTMNDPLYQKLSYLGSAGKSAQFLQNSPFRYVENQITNKKGENVTVADVELLKDVKPFFEIIEPLIEKGAMTGVEDYLVNRRNLELYKRAEQGKIDYNTELLKAEPDLKQLEIFEKEKSLGKKATNTRKDTEAILREKEDRYGKDNLRKISGEIRKYQDAVLRYYKDAGMLSNESYLHIKELNKDYVPFKRYIDYLEEGKSATDAWAQIGKESEVREGVRSFKASTRDIQHEVLRPRETILENTYELIKRADQNRANVAMLDALITIDPTIVGKPVPVGLKNVKGKDNIVTVYRNGKQVAYELYDNHFAHLFKPPTQTPKVLKMFLPISNLLKKGAVTYNVEFLIKNPVRDQITGTINSRFGYKPIDWLTGFLANTAQNLELKTGKGGKLADMAEVFKASGAEQAMLTTMMAMNKNYDENQFFVQDPYSRLQYNKKSAREFQEAVNRGDMEKIEEMMQTSPNTPLAVWANKYKKRPWEMIADLNMNFEMATRQGAFMRAYNETGDVMKAMKEAREMVADYSIGGANMRPIMGLYPFLNANIQHEYMIGRTLFGGHMKKSMLQGLQFITAPTIGAWVWNNYMNGEEGREAYAEMEPWRRHYFFNFYVPGLNEFYSVPKGFFGWLYGTTVENGLDAMLDFRPQVAEEIGQYWLYPPVKELLGPVLPMSDDGSALMPTAFAPQFARPIQEVMTNQKFYTGRPITPHYITEGKYLTPDLQYKQSTADIYIGMAEQANQLGIPGLKNLNAQEFQHLIQGYGGGVARQAMQVAEYMGKKTGIMEPGKEEIYTSYADRPVFRAFLARKPEGIRTASGQQFYKIHRKMKTIWDSNQVALDKSSSDPAIQEQLMLETTGLSNVAKGISEYNEKGADYLYYLKYNKKIEAMKSAFAWIGDQDFKMKRKLAPYNTEEFSNRTTEQKHADSKVLNDIILKNAQKFLSAYREYHKASKELGRPAMENTEWEYTPEMAFFVNIMRKGGLLRGDGTNLQKWLKKEYSQPVNKVE